MAPHSSTLAWKIPWMEEPGGLPINLDVLSSVLCGWGSIETTVRIRLKARGRKLKSKT